MSRPQTIQIFLHSGNPSGIRTAELTTRTIRATEVPRSDLTTFRSMAEANQVALYFLFGEDEISDVQQCYIGQTGASRTRLNNHDQEKDFWDRVVVITSNNHSITDTHVKYLEWKSIQLATAANRFELQNGNAGSKPHTPAPLEADCEEILETITTLIGTLGYPVFVGLRKVEDKSAPEFDSSRIVYCEGRSGTAKASGIYGEQGLVVFKGSTAALTPTNEKLGEVIAARRERLAKQGVLAIEDDKVYFLKDHAFKTPSGACDVVLFRAGNGWTEWKTKDGTTLHDLTGRSLD